PPYQEEAQGTSTSDDPIYHYFLDESYKISRKSILITPARFLFNAGKTPKVWNKKILSDEHMKVSWYEQDSSKVFSGT
ncbi:Eco57I restriction-modification methylase domain-containing protein, partial [Streptococcus pyogenes]